MASPVKISLFLGWSSRIRHRPAGSLLPRCSNTPSSVVGGIQPVVTCELGRAIETPRNLGVVSILGILAALLILFVGECTLSQRSTDKSSISTEKQVLPTQPPHTAAPAHPFTDKP